MKLEKWALIAEIAGAIAIVITVVVLIFEVRGNTDAIRAASAQSITDATTDVLTLLASDPDLVRFRVAGDLTIREPFIPTIQTTQIDRTLSDIDRWRYFFYYRQHWLRFQNMYLQTQSGVLGPDTWNTYADIICYDITDTGRPGIRATWPDHANVLNLDFVDLVESCPGFE